MSEAMEEKNNKKKIVVYTCIVNNYDSLRPIPDILYAKMKDSVDFICLTDNVDLYSANPGNWNIIEMPVQLANLLATNPVKAQRMVKILPMKFLPDRYYMSLWIDSNIEIKSNLLTDFFPKYDLNKCPIYTNRHPQRRCIYDEELMVIRLKKDSPEVCKAQIAQYMGEKYPVNNGLAETNVILRRNNDPGLGKMSYLWAEQILKWSKRDQLSFDYSCWKTGLKYGHLKEDYVSGKVMRRVPHGKPKELVKIEELEKRERELLKKIKKTSEEMQDYPIVSVVMTTHNRTAVAIACLESLIRNLSYSGKIRFVICDDRSEVGHSEAIEETLINNKISDYCILKTTENAWGLGASMNNGLKNSFLSGDVVLTTEDDWLLVRKLDITDYVLTLIRNDIAGIRLATTSAPDSLENSEIDGFFRFKKDNAKQFIFNNQVMLRHKRIFDKIGFMKENCSADDQEKNIVSRYNTFTDFGKKCPVLYPKCLNILPALTGDKNFFHHIGKSTLGKNRPLEEKYKRINDENLDKAIRKRAIDLKNVKISIKSNDVTIGMATVPWRRGMLFQTVCGLITQCSRMCISLNNYGCIPEELRQLKQIYNDKLILKLAGEGQELTDFGCQNKMYWVGKFDGYYLSVDDDIFYPKDYVEKMVTGINRYNGKAICSFHGAIYNLKDRKIDKTARYKKTFWFNKSLGKDVLVHRLGMGLGGFCPLKVGLSWEKDFTHVKNSGDDEDIIVFSQKTNTKLICLCHREGWIRMNNQLTVDRRALSGNSKSREILHEKTDNLIFREEY